MTASLFLSLAILAITLLGWMSQWFWPSWILDLASSFQVQYAIANLILWLLLLSHSLKRHSNSKNRTAIYSGLILGLACLSFQASLLGSWYRSANVAMAASPSPLQPFKILSVNIHPSNEDYAPLLNLIQQEKPDLVLLQEATALSLERLGTLHPLLPHHLEKVPPGQRQAGEKYPPKGTAIFSRLPLELEATEPNSPFGRAGLSARIQTDPSDSASSTSAGFQIYAVHALVPDRPSFYRQRNDQLTAVFSAASEVSVPAIAMGDFNTAIWSPALKSSQTQQLRPVRAGFGIVPTWRPNLALPKGLQWLSNIFWIPIDHCYISPGITLQDFRTGPDVNSDHLPLIVELQIPTTT